MKRVTIAVDVDDVLAAHVPAFIAFSNEYYGTNLTVEDYTEHWADIWHVERDEIERRASEFHVPETLLRFQKDNSADVVLSTLAKNYDLAIVTARREHTLNATHEWLDTHFYGVFKEVHFVPIWEPNNTVTKADICKNIGASYLIDDLARHCNLAAENGIKSLLFGDYSWNRKEELIPGVTRVKDWPAVLEYFNAT